MEVVVEDCVGWKIFGIVFFILFLVASIGWIIYAFYRNDIQVFNPKTPVEFKMQIENTVNDSCSKIYLYGTTDGLSNDFVFKENVDNATRVQYKNGKLIINNKALSLQNKCQIPIASSELSFVDIDDGTIWKSNGKVFYIEMENMYAILTPFHGRNNIVLGVTYIGKDTIMNLQTIQFVDPMYE